jgi:hypothetical protein
MSFLRLLIAWPGLVLRWLREEEAKLFYTFIAPILLTWIVWWLVFDAWEVRLRWTGLTLELLGLLMVVVGLSETRKRFGRPSILDRARSYFKRFPTLRRRDAKAHISGVASLSFAGSLAKIHARSSVAPNTPLEQRIAILEGRLDQVETGLIDANERIEREAAERAAAIKTEQQARAAGVEQIRKSLEVEAVGGIHLETMGAWWIALGMLLASGSAEFSKWFFGPGA